MPVQVLRRFTSKAITQSQHSVTEAVGPPPYCSNGPRQRGQAFQSVMGT